MKKSYSIRRPQLGRLLLWIVDRLVPFNEALTALSPAESLVLCPVTTEPTAVVPSSYGTRGSISSCAAFPYAVYCSSAADFVEFHKVR